MAAASSSPSAAPPPQGAGVGLDSLLPPDSQQQLVDLVGQANPQLLIEALSRRLQGGGEGAAGEGPSGSGSPLPLPAALERAQEGRAGSGEGDSGEEDSLIDSEDYATDDFDAEEEKLLEEDELRRKFQFKLQSLTVRDVSKSVRPKMRIILGGNRQKVRENGRDKLDHKGRKMYIGKHGNSFWTPIVPGGTMDEPSVEKRIKKGQSGTLFLEKKLRWWGSYQQLREQSLIIKVYDIPRYCGVNCSWMACKKCTFRSIGVGRLKLVNLADGHFRQQVPIYIPSRRNEPRRQTAIVEICCYFEEVCTLKLEYKDWWASELNMGPHPNRHRLRLSLPKDWASVRGFVSFFRPKRWRGAILNRKVKSGKARIEKKRGLLQWEHVGKEMLFYGTRSMLEQSDLNIKVFGDQHLGRLTDLRGQACVPLSGVLETQVVSSRLKVKTPDGLGFQNAGIIEGGLEIVNEPQYRQKGFPVIPKHHHTYLAVLVEACENLIAGSSDGYSDPFVTLSFENITVQTSVIYKTLSPTFREFLFIPISIVDKSISGLSSLTPIVLTVYGKDFSGAHFLGEARLSVFDILKQPMREVDNRCKWKKGAETPTLFRARRALLTSEGVETEQFIVFSAFFIDDLEVPDLPESYEDVSRPKMAVDLSEPMLRQELKFKAEIRQRTGKSGDFPIKMMDENFRQFFLPRYINPFKIIRRDSRLFPGDPGEQDIESQLHRLSRMVRMIPWRSNEELFHRKADVLASPQFFLNILKGDAEDHTLLLANLFLSDVFRDVEKDTTLDVYICIGKTTNKRRHTWLLVRDFSRGDVVFWETTNNRQYRLPRKFNPSFVTAVTAASRGDGPRPLHPIVDPSDFGGSSSQADRSVQGLDLGGVGLEIPLEDLLREMSHIVPEGGEVRYDEPLALEHFERADLLRPTNVIAGVVSRQEGGVRSGLPYASIEVVFNGSNVWANLESENPAAITYNFEDPECWLPFLTPEDRELLIRENEDLGPFYTETRLRPPMSSGIRCLRERIIKEEIIAHFRQHRSFKGLPPLRRNRLLEDHMVDGCKILEEIEGTPPGRIQSLREERNNVYKELQRMHMLANQADEEGLEEGVSAVDKPSERQIQDKLLEFKELDRRFRKYDFHGYWKAALKGNIVPSTMRFVGKPFNFATFDPMAIRKYLMEHYNVQDEPDERAEFGVAVLVSSYVCTVNSIWVFLAKLVPRADRVDSQ